MRKLLTGGLGKVKSISTIVSCGVEQQHMRIGLMDDPWHCSCGKSYPTSEGLQDHIKNIQV